MKFNLKSLFLFAFVTSVLGILAFIFDFGFYNSDGTQRFIDAFYIFVIFTGLVSTFVRHATNKQRKEKKVYAFDSLSVLYSLFILFLYIFVGEAFKADVYLHNPLWIIFAVILTFIREFSEIRINYNRTYFNPAQFFILSFLIIILAGTMLLMLPNATNGSISFIDSLFTATSAVCVTGLTVVDTGTHYTVFGQSIILFLIQIGGLGILTFASYFSYFFKGGTSYENQLSLSEMTNSQKLGEVFTTLKYILIITITIEFTSASLIYLSLDPALIPSFLDRIYFSVFHAISAFCNAGFSTLSDNIYDVGFRYNYSFQLVLIFTLVFGGLGFPIVVNVLKYFRHRLSFLFYFKSKKKKYKPWVLNLNSRITLITTTSLILFAFILFFIIEYNQTLAHHNWFGKIVTALFGATTPRTAGFNTVDMTELAFPTVMITIFMMWIGASPASTGGGIKTSTLAIATLNIISLAKGKSRIEVYRREIADISVRRAFATIALSLIVIGLGILFISINDPEKGLLNIAFECFSAYSTVGLSLGITASLSAASKFVLIVIMFVGRVSMLTILVAIINKVKHKNYRYPTEEITIN